MLWTKVTTSPIVFADIMKEKAKMNISQCWNVVSALNGKI